MIDLSIVAAGLELPKDFIEDPKAVKDIGHDIQIRSHSCRVMLYSAWSLWVKEGKPSGGTTWNAYRTEIRNAYLHDVIHDAMDAMMCATVPAEAQQSANKEAVNQALLGAMGAIASATQASIGGAATAAIEAALRAQHDAQQGQSIAGLMANWPDILRSFANTAAEHTQAEDQRQQAAKAITQAVTTLIDKTGGAHQDAVDICSSIVQTMVKVAAEHQNAESATANMLDIIGAALKSAESATAEQNQEAS